MNHGLLKNEWITKKIERELLKEIVNPFVRDILKIIRPRINEELEDGLNVHELLKEIPTRHETNDIHLLGFLYV